MEKQSGCNLVAQRIENLYLRRSPTGLLPSLPALRDDDRSIGVARRCVHGSRFTNAIFSEWLIVSWHPV
jgi:hypothetical protein